MGAPSHDAGLRNTTLEPAHPGRRNGRPMSQLHSADASSPTEGWWPERFPAHSKEASLLLDALRKICLLAPAIEGNAFQFEIGLMSLHLQIHPLTSFSRLRLATPALPKAFQSSDYGTSHHVNWVTASRANKACSTRQ